MIDNNQKQQYFDVLNINNWQIRDIKQEIINSLYIYNYSSSCLFLVLNQEPLDNKQEAFLHNVMLSFPKNNQEIKNNIYYNKQQAWSFLKNKVNNYSLLLIFDHKLYNYLINNNIININKTIYADHVNTVMQSAIEKLKLWQQVSLKLLVK